MKGNVPKDLDPIAWLDNVLTHLSEERDKDWNKNFQYFMLSSGGS